MSGKNTHKKKKHSGLQHCYIHEYNDIPKVLNGLREKTKQRNSERIEVV